MAERAVVIAPVKGWQQGLIRDLVVRLRAVDVWATGPVDEGVGREKGRHPDPGSRLLGFEPRKWEGRQQEQASYANRCSHPLNGSNPMTRRMKNRT